MSTLTHAYAQNQIAKVEQLLNPLDRIPVCCSFSGVIRILASQVEIAAGAVFIALKICQSAWNRNINTVFDAKQGFAYIKHGFLNIMRGSLSILPFIQLSFWVYDYKIGRYNYELELVRENVYPLAQPNNCL